jgi:hypothetical protein
MVDLAALTLREERHEAWLRAHRHSIGERAVSIETRAR